MSEKRNFYTNENGLRKGPFTCHEIRALIRDGLITRDESLLDTNGKRVTAEEIERIEAITGDRPPIEPPPPPLAYDKSMRDIDRSLHALTSRRVILIGLAVGACRIMYTFWFEKPKPPQRQNSMPRTFHEPEIPKGWSKQ